MGEAVAIAPHSLCVLPGHVIRSLLATESVQPHAASLASRTHSHTPFTHAQQTPLCADAGEPVADSPYPLRVLPGRPEARRCTLSGSGRRAAVAAAASEVVVEARDCDGNRLV